jgi:non-homologous end joining protein Ku
VLEIVKAKAAGQEIEKPPPEPEPTPDLLGALEASIADAKKRGAGKGARAKSGGGKKREKAKA